MRGEGVEDLGDLDGGYGAGGGEEEVGFAVGRVGGGEEGDWGGRLGRAIGS